MSGNRDESQPVFSGSEHHREQIIASFEEAWQGTDRPSIERFLVGEGQERHALLVELVHVDLEYRLKAGEDVPVEEYLDRYPELAQDPETVVDLICAGHRLRGQRGAGGSVEELLQRFPKYRDRLTERLAGETQPPPPRRFPVRIHCPHCRNPIALGEDATGPDTVCPTCGSTFRIEPDASRTWRPEHLPRLGRFELLAVAGRGAFGTVYRARDTELDRIVAVKVPRSGAFASREDEDRFVREARAVAQLRHPGIVPVYEVGHTEEFPYLVTEFVEGVTLSDALTGRRFAFQEAAEIVAQAAEALDHSHRQGVVHRDMKPSNLLLRESDGQITVLVTDFGLALRDDGEVTVTVEGQVLGTPAYMSPEQARGEGHGVDGRSDVYSLGVILYELLVGELPFRGNSRMLLHQVLYSEPQGPQKLNDRIPRDLETICLKCLEKEPGKRYASARELADDLRRFQRGESIRARPVGRAEKAWRWARRSPGVAGLLAAVFFLLVTISVGSTIAAVLIASAREDERRHRIDAEAASRESQSARAEERRQRGIAIEAERQAKAEAARARTEEQKARRTADFLVGLFRTADPLPLGDMGFRAGEAEKVANVTVQQVLNRGAERISKELKDQPLVQAALMDTLGNACRSNGLYKDAGSLLEDALRIRQGALPPGHLDLATSLASLAWLRHDLGDYAAAEELYAKALAIRRADPAANDLDIAGAAFNLAWVQSNRGRHREAEALFREVLEVRLRKLPKGDRDVQATELALLSVEFARTGDKDAAIRKLVALLASTDSKGASRLLQAAATYSLAMMVRLKRNYDLASPFYAKALVQVREIFGSDNNFLVVALLADTAGMLREMGELREAEMRAREALRTARNTVGAHPLMPDPLRELAEFLYLRGDYDEGETLLRQALAMSRDFRRGPHAETAKILVSLGNALLIKGDYAGSEQAYGDGLAMFQTLDGGRRAERVGILIEIACGLHQRGAFREAEPYFREAIELRRTANEPFLVTGYIERFADFLRDRGSYEEAAKLEQEVQSNLRKIVADKLASEVWTCTVAAEMLARRGDLDEAERLLRVALDRQRADSYREHPEIARAMFRLANALKDKGVMAEAETLHRQALEIRRKKLGPDDPTALESLIALAELLHAKGDAKEAIAMGEEALATARRRFGPEHRRTADFETRLASLYRAASEWRKAEPLLREACQIRRKKLGDAHPDLTASIVDLAELLMAERDFKQAVAILRESRTAMEKSLPADCWRTALVAGMLGACLAAQDRSNCPEAEPLLLNSHRTLQAAFGPQDKRCREAARRLAALYETWGKPEQVAKYRELAAPSTAPGSKPKP